MQILIFADMIKRETLEPLNKDQIIDLFVEFSHKVEMQLNEMKEDIRVLKQENQRLKSQNSRNSYRPPSHDLGCTPKQKSLRKPSNKKSGGQKGHKGTTLFQSHNPDHIIKHTPKACCPTCDKTNSAEAFKLQSKGQVVDIPPIQATVTEHQVYQLRCNCGCVSKSEFPAGVTAPIQYGSRLVSFVSYLSTRQYIPFGRLPELLKCICNVSLNEGTIYDMLNSVADNLLPVYEGIKQDIANATVVGSDESGVKVNNGNHWAWTWQSANETFITITPSWGYVTIANEFPTGFPDAILVSDSLSTQLKTPAHLHQLCLAHLMRELNAFIEGSKNQWAQLLKTLFEKAIELKRTLMPDRYDEPLEERCLFELALDKILECPLQKDVPKLSAFQKRLRKWRKAIFAFLYHPDVPFDNNGSERAIRNIKVKQKVSGGFRSDRGATIFAIIRSAIDTWIKRSADVFFMLKFSIELAEDKTLFYSLK
ncbi:IS66 family transposase [Labilibacter marinus]|uniref:IS66 family transposase n=1 Tax=Labilibacter marinus TaxID=1477105 RepID=UPI00082E4F28|nr:IS66 family transposase [Labilibacter marinus]